MNPKAAYESAKSKAAPLVSQLKIDATFNQKYVKMVAKLTYIVGTHFKNNLLPVRQGSAINVLSLACGDPVEFLALKIIYPNCRINFVGIDLDEKSNAEVRSAFANFRECKILTANANDPLAIVQALKEYGIALDGFSLVFLRQPNILDAQVGKIFRNIVQNVIPFVAAKDSRVFISTYHREEVIAVDKIVADKSLDNIYATFPTGGTCAMTGVYKIAGVSRDGQIHPSEPDSYSILLRCQGMAFQLDNKNAASLSLGNSSHSLWQSQHSSTADKSAESAQSAGSSQTKSEADATVGEDESRCDTICPKNWCVVI